MLFTKSDIGTFSKGSGQLLQWYLVIPKPDPVTNTQHHLAKTYPGIITIQKTTIPGISIDHPHAAVLSQFDVGVLTGDGCVLDNEVAGCFPAYGFDVQNTFIPELNTRQHNTM